MLEAATSVVPAPPRGGRGPLPEQDVMPILPPQPKTLRDTGLDRQLVLALLVKAIHQAGTAHLPSLAGKLRLSMGVMREALDLLTLQQMAQIASRGHTDIDVQYRLTERGEEFAAECLAQCRYVGPAPVTLEALRAVLAADAERNAQGNRVTPAELAAALADDGIDGALREQLGAALHSGRAILLHGPSGSGKSFLARRLGRLLQGVVAVPSAVLVGQQIVQFYDPLVHLKPLAVQGRQFDERNCDLRWQICQRPLVQVGTELTRAMLDLRFDPSNRIYHAPPHIKASGGLFVIDDLGRQEVAAAELLNRFIGPLDNGTDRLTIQGGYTETIPFSVTLVLATNLAPSQLLDAPLLRRIGYKIQLGALSEASYRALLRRQCYALRVAYDEDGADYLLTRLHAAAAQPLLPIYPRELLGRIGDFASFAGTVPRLTIAALEQAWASMPTCASPATLPLPTPSRGPVLIGDKS